MAETQKTTATKAPAKKAAARKSAPRKTAARPAARKQSAMDVARAAARQLSELTGREPECVTGVQRTEDGWEVEIEVVESRRIPDSTDILATYRVQVDADGDLTGYHRARRYVRGKGGDGDGGGGR
ncbi:hypothetical protein FB382_001936 [Nocardioides ginsengisegetis]|uniref:Gas vesicle synthesis protein GvpO n=1 Tax=Nocardioides ginsengisegetis TaxID=661491 RepID=A0A7W3IZW7_9ACTN|nr:gas vesicle protein [Nocardioides ginsengisegetis]MBA8803645.1 hypothetical protein [Nocardioides ginsengisegetis]